MIRQWLITLYEPRIPRARMHPWQFHPSATRITVTAAVVTELRRCNWGTKPDTIVPNNMNPDAQLTASYNLPTHACLLYRNTRYNISPEEIIFLFYFYLTVSRLGSNNNFPEETT